MTTDAIVFTEENLNYNPERKIPSVCNELCIECLNFNGFMECNSWEF